MFRERRGKCTGWTMLSEMFGKSEKVYLIIHNHFFLIFHILLSFFIINTVKTNDTIDTKLKHNILGDG